MASITCKGASLVTLLVAAAVMQACGAEQATQLSSASSPAALIERDGQLYQPVRLVIQHPGEPAQVEVRIGDRFSQTVPLEKGSHEYEVLLPQVTQEQTVLLDVTLAGKSVVSQSLILRPVRKLTVYILPHSHTDIGYTAIQTEIERKQVDNLLQGMKYARQTADYPEGARFVWNVEVLWAADLYLQRMDDAQRAEFYQAVKNGQVALQGMYLNELTGLCRPEELVRLFRFATQLAQQCDVTIDSAMISDVPGYTWGTVTAMAQAGIKYFSVAPNYFDRIGDILVQWENKPFYWVGPTGQDRVLVWIPYRGYATSHIIRELTGQFVEEYQRHLDDTQYRFDIAYLRWAGHGDNAVPDPTICEFVKDWNEKYAWPEFIITSTGQAFRAFEARYGDQLPEVHGDWTPYWEDGAGSSARETALNRASSDRLVQAESLWAMFAPQSYPVPAFKEAWNHVLLYSEHTWGAWCSVTEPERQETQEQWEIKQSYANKADRQSRDLLRRALHAFDSQPDASRTAAGLIDVLNTASWTRTELVHVPAELSAAGDRVTDSEGRPLPSQRLRSGELAFLAKDVPPLGSRRFTIHAGPAQVVDRVTVTDSTLDNGLLRLHIDEKTGGIDRLEFSGLEMNLADLDSSHTLNEYLYLIGDDTNQLQRSGAVRISVQEPGPLVACLQIESAAPGCRRLTRTVRMIAGLDRVELLDRVDKERLVATDYRETTGKESVNFAFAFQVPEGQVRLHVPFGVIRPEIDQIPSACKNWFTVSRWADVSNNDFGVTWVTLDSPLVQVGGITATLLNSQTNPDVWRKRVVPTQQIYCWAMNNHWGTNYRAYQEGPTEFRFVLCPHRQYCPVTASRLAINYGQPLLVQPARGPQSLSPLLRVDSDQLLVTGLKPADDGAALIVRLWDASGTGGSTRIDWPRFQPRQIWLSDTSERPLRRLDTEITVPPWGLVTLRADLP